MVTPLPSVTLLVASCRWSTIFFSFFFCIELWNCIVDGVLVGLYRWLVAMYAGVNTCTTYSGSMIDRRISGRTYTYVAVDENTSRGPVNQHVVPLFLSRLGKYFFFFARRLAKYCAHQLASHIVLLLYTPTCAHVQVTPCNWDVYMRSYRYLYFKRKSPALHISVGSFILQQLASNICTTHQHSQPTPISFVRLD